MLSWPKQTLMVLGALSVAGCDPQFNLSGAYFPAWLACLFGGLLGTWALHLGMVRLGIAKYLWPAPLVYVALFVCLTSAIWLVFFSA